MEDPKEPNEVNDKINCKLWQTFSNETTAAALKLNFKHASSSSCNILCAKQSLKSTNIINHLPYPLSQNAEHCLKDTVPDLVNKKRDFQLTVDEITSRFKRNQKLLNARKQFQCYEHMQCALEKDPDEYFCSNYNWYYTGGNLQFQCVGENNLLFHVLNKKLAVARVKRKPTHWKVNKKETISTEFEEQVYHLDSFNKNNIILVSAREKNKINLFEISTEEDNTIKSNIINTQTSKIPFVGDSINKNQGREYTTIDATQVLKIWDIETNCQKFNHNIPIHSNDLDGDHFAQISYRNDNTLTYINRTQLYLLDTRSNCKSNIFLKNTDLISSFDRFTNICLNVEYDSNFFISSFRDILQMDVRYLSAVNKWCHTFDSAPLLSDLKTINGQNVYCVSSANPIEKILIDDANLPEYLPSCIKSFETSLLHNPYLNKQEDILLRLGFHTSGLQMFHKDGKTVLFTVNSAGDLFSQNIRCDESENNGLEKINKKFKKWNDTIFEWGKQPPNFENIVVVDKVVLKDLNLNYNDKPVTTENQNKKNKIKECILDLKRIKKGTNSKITDIWFDVNDQDNLDNIEQIEPHANITNWLNQTSLITPENNIE